MVGGRSLAAAGLHCQQGFGTECSACVLARPRYVVIRYTRRLHSYALSVLLLYRHGPPSMPDSAVLAPSARALAMAVNRRKMRARRAKRGGCFLFDTALSRRCRRPHVFRRGHAHVAPALHGHRRHRAPARIERMVLLFCCVTPQCQKVRGWHTFYIRRDLLACCGPEAPCQWDPCRRQGRSTPTGQLTRPTCQEEAPCQWDVSATERLTD